MELLYFSSKGAIKYADNPIISNKEEIIQSIIEKIWVVITPLTSYKARKYFKPFIDLAPKNPACLSYANYTHAFIVAQVTMKNQKNLISIEFGAYDDRREGDYKNQVHYYYETQQGLRIIKLNEDDLKRVNAKGNKIISCNIKNKITIDQLIFDTQFCGKLHIWNYHNYNIFDQNCQLFVREAIKILGATRATKVTKDPTFTIKYIPLKVSSALEDNEKGRNQSKNQKKFNSQMKSYLYKLSIQTTEKQMLLTMLSTSISAFDDHFTHRSAIFQFKKYLKFHSNFDNGLTNRIKNYLKKFGIIV